MKFVLSDKDDIDICMMTAFRKKIAHASTGIRVIQTVIQYKETRLTPWVFKIKWYSLDFQI